jgi:hypothetical protein
MGWTYQCPKCHAMLNPGETVVLVGEHDGLRLLIGFHPQPGNYQIYLPPDVAIAEGEHWSFYCPVCRASLVAGDIADLCELRMLDGDTEHRVFFSRIAGEHATFVVKEREIAQRHGEHVAAYLPRLAPIRY